MANKNHNIRFNPSKEDELRAWEKLHSEEVEQMFKSKNSFVLQAINYYYDKCLAMNDDPYLETREKEDAFIERIANMVDQKVLSNIPALAGMYLMQQQAFVAMHPMNVPVNRSSVSASMQSGITPVMPQMNPQMQESKQFPSSNSSSEKLIDDSNVDVTESDADVEENEYVDFNMF